MITRNDLLFTIRNLGRHKLLAVINLIGLTVGITSFLVIILIIRFEISFDRFQPDRERIFRVYSELKGPLNRINRGAPTALYSQMKEQFTGIESLTNFQTFDSPVSIPAGAENKKDFGDYNRIILTRPDYFDVFNYYEWIVGNPELSLSQPFQVVLTEGRARIYFGDLKPSGFIGREILYGDSLRVTVSGVVKDVKNRTDLDFTEFISLSTIDKCWLKSRFSLDSWTGINSSSQLFIKLMHNVPIIKIENQLPLLAKTFSKTYRNEWNNSPKIQSIKDLHFNSNLGIFDHSRQMPERSTLLILAGIASLIMISALINFVNLVTADNARRAKEVGVRKVLGSSRRKIVLQFLFETLILIVFALILSLALIWLIIQNFTSYIPQGFKYDPTEPFILAFLISFTLVITFLAAIYPAFVLTSYTPVVALKNNAYLNSDIKQSIFIRRSLIVLQFTCSQILIFVTIAIVLQVNFLLNKDLGFSSEKIIYFYTPWKEDSSKQLFLTNEIVKISEVQMAAVGLPPNSRGISSTIGFGEGKEVKYYQVNHKEGDDGYLDLYNIEILAGRNFNHGDGLNEYLINEKLLHQLGFNSPLEVLGKPIDNTYSIIGVVKDFHIKDLHSLIEPVVISKGASNCIGVKFNSKDVGGLKSSLEKLRSAWDKTYPDVMFEYWFLDEQIEKSYEDESRMKSLCMITTIIALIISCLGLYGLSTFLVVRRTKEIGIRKVLGSTSSSIMILLSKDYVKLVLIAFIIAAPIGYYIVDDWLNKFAYRISINLGVYFLSLLISSVIAFLSISTRTLGAARMNPVTSLRYE